MRRAKRATKRRSSRKKRARDRIKMTIRGKDGVVRPAFIIDPDSGCWNSTGSDNRNGYRSQSRTSAHRDAYARLNGDMPEGFEAHHLCENKPCVNATQHIIAVSSADHRRIHRFLEARRLAGTT